MLKKLQLTTMNRIVAHFVPGDDEDHFELSPSYQRSSVWTIEQRRNLIRSMLMGIPIGAVVVNIRGEAAEKFYAVVDGKQRIETIRSFVADGFTVPASWFADEDITDARTEDGESVVRFSGLDLGARRAFSHSLVACVESQVRSEAAEAEIFMLINSAGTSQTAEDLARAAAIAEA